MNSNNEFLNNILNDINTMSSPIENDSNTIELQCPEVNSHFWLLGLRLTLCYCSVGYCLCIVM